MVFKHLSYLRWVRYLIRLLTQDTKIEIVQYDIENTKRFTLLINSASPFSNHTLTFRCLEVYP